MNTAGAAAQAQPYLQQAFQRFEALGERGAGMASKSLTELGDCLTDLGQLEQAVAVYQEAIQRSEKLGDARGLAVKKGQLATAYLRQKDYAAALQAYHQALALFQQLNEPSAIATLYHQIGMVYKEQSQFDQAESAFRQSLAIRVANQYRADEAASLGELANLNDDWNRPEQAVDYYRQAADIYIQLGDKRYEGAARGNLANTLIKLKRLNEARPELLRAIECKKSFCHAAEPWTTWAILNNLELADGNPQAVQQARQKAMNAFLSYRRDGGENHEGAGRLALMVLQAIQQDDTAEIEQTIEQYLEQDDQQHKTFLRNLKAILAGQRNPELAEDDDMNYQLIVELKLLLEQLP